MTDLAKKSELFYQLLSDTYLLYRVKCSTHFSEPEPNDISLARFKEQRESIGVLMGGGEGRGAKRSLAASLGFLGYIFMTVGWVGSVGLITGTRLLKRLLTKFYKK
jgi:hypothetical protein